MKLLEEFKSVCGNQFVLTASEISEKYTLDWTKRAQGAPLAVTLPQTTKQVSEVLKICNHHKISVRPQGGHTGMCGGATPTKSNQEIVLSLEKMNSIRDIDNMAMTMTADAGCILEQVRIAATKQGMLFPLNIGSKGSCQIGGNLATNAGGLNVVKYGNTRGLCLGLEAVMANGDILNLLSGLRKNNTGYDLKNLIIGSEGTLAVITAATLKLFPLPSVAITAWLSLASPTAALNVMRRLQEKMDNALCAFEMMPKLLFDLIARYQAHIPLPFNQAPQWGVLLELEGGQHVQEKAQEILMAALEEGLVLDIVISQTESQRQNFWHIREISFVINIQHGRWIQTDVAIPISSLPAFIQDLEQKLPAICSGLYEIGYGHMGDGNLHVNARPYDQDPANHPSETAAILEALYDLTAAYQGTFSAEHGIGQFKVDALEKYKDKTALQVMQNIKESLDPHHILNPGRVLRQNVSSIQ